MSVPSLREEPLRVDEPQAAQEYAAVLILEARCWPRD
jgi:hypothetical protein